MESNKIIKDGRKEKGIPLNSNLILEFNGYSVVKKKCFSIPVEIVAFPRQGVEIYLSFLMVKSCPVGVFREAFLAETDNKIRKLPLKPRIRRTCVLSC